jgi:hypothetical protein
MNSKLAIITFVDDDGARPDQGLPGGSGGHPWLPGHLGGARPDQGLPGGGYPSQGLPGSGARPDQGLPGGGGHPSTGLPPVYPSQGLPKPPSGGHPWLPGAIGGGAPPDRPINLPVYPPEGSNLPATDLRFVLRWLACHGWVLVPDGTPDPEPKA